MSYSVWELVLFLLVVYLPALTLIVWPFRNRLRYSFKVSVVLILLASVLEVVCMYLAIHFEQLKSAFNLLALLLLPGFGMLLVKDRFPKVLYHTLIVFNLTNLVIILGKCLEGAVFHDNALLGYKWSYALCALAVEAVLFFVFLRICRYLFEEVIELDMESNEWNYLWIVPGIFYLMLVVMVYCSGRTTLELYMAPTFALGVLMINVGSFLVYWIIADLMKERDQNVKLAYENSILMEQNRQYADMSRKIKDVRKSAHDARHHLGILQYVADSGELDVLKKYIEDYSSAMVKDLNVIYCENTYANTVLNYYAQQCRQEEIEYHVRFELPAECSISDMDMCSVLGNLLENAVEACRKMTEGKRYIEVGGELRGSTFYLTVDNSVSEAPVFLKSGELESSKFGGAGIGTHSVKSVAEKYGGSSSFEYHDGVFEVSVMMRVDQQETEEEA